MNIFFSHKQNNDRVRACSGCASVLLVRFHKKKYFAILILPVRVFLFERGRKIKSQFARRSYFKGALLFCHQIFAKPKGFPFIGKTQRDGSESLHMYTYTQTSYTKYEQKYWTTYHLYFGGNRILILFFSYMLGVSNGPAKFGASVKIIRRFCFSVFVSA